MDEADDFDLDNLFGDVPELERLGFFQDYRLDYFPEFNEVANKLNELLSAAELFTDEYGYTWRMDAGTVDEAMKRVAWVEWKENARTRVVDVHYYLKARDQSGLCLRWEIETYNPYFGCMVGFLKWIDHSVVMIYREKHHSYVASLQKDSPVKREQISDEWQVTDNVVFYRSEVPDQVDRLTLPAL